MWTDLKTTGIISRRANSPAAIAFFFVSILIRLSTIDYFPEQMYAFYFFN
jgi:hypothetical protein